VDRIDRAILSRISDSIEIAERPFAALARELSIGEDEVVERIRSLRRRGLIRRIGAVVDPGRIGWVSTLCALDLPEERIDEFAELSARFEEITHSYVREGSPNCWFTVIAKSRGRISEIASEISRALGTKVLNLPARRVFKIKVSFDLERHRIPS
jgi:DNA-binding Lrp family transcriptional regulator